MIYLCFEEALCYLPRSFPRLEDQYLDLQIKQLSCPSVLCILQRDDKRPDPDHRWGIGDWNKEECFLRPLFDPFFCRVIRHIDMYYIDSLIESCSTKRGDSTIFPTHYRLLILWCDDVLANNSARFQWEKPARTGGLKGWRCSGRGNLIMVGRWSGALSDYLAGRGCWRHTAARPEASGSGFPSVFGHPIDHADRQEWLFPVTGLCYFVAAPTYLASLNYATPIGKKSSPSP